MNKEQENKLKLYLGYNYIEEETTLKLNDEIYIIEVDYKDKSIYIKTDYKNDYKIILINDVFFWNDEEVLNQFIKLAENEFYTIVENIKTERKVWGSLTVWYEHNLIEISEEGEELLIIDKLSNTEILKITI